MSTVLGCAVARHMRFLAMPRYLFVCNYACSKQNPGALDNVTRPFPDIPPHLAAVPLFTISHFPFPIGRGVACSFQCCATWHTRMQMRWIRASFVPCALETEHESRSRSRSKPFGHCQQFRLRLRLRPLLSALTDCELRRVSCLPTRLVCLLLLSPVYMLCQLSTILSCF